MATIEPPWESRILIQHMIDRACIGYCFSYGNYEPSSGVFRVRSTPGNPYVLNDYEDAVNMEDGYYTVQPQDLPVYEVYECDAPARASASAPSQPAKKTTPPATTPARSSPRQSSPVILRPASGRRIFPRAPGTMLPTGAYGGLNN